MREHPHAADVLRHHQRRAQREQQQRRRMSLPLKFPVHSKLTEQCRGHRIGLIAPPGLGQERALDLRGTQRDVADDPPRRDLGDDICPRHAAGLVGPGVPAEPGVQRVSPAVEQEAVVVLGQRARRRDACDGSVFPGRPAARELGQSRNGLSRAGDPGLERLPVLGRDGDDDPVQHLDFRRLQSLAAHEITQAGARLLCRRFEDGTLVGADANAEDRGRGRHD
jgi:hypothetical protein